MSKQPNDLGYPNPRPHVPLSWKSIAWVSLAGLAVLLSSIQGVSFPSAILFLGAVAGFSFSEWIERNRWERMEALESTVRDLKERAALKGLFG